MISIDGVHLERDLGLHLLAESEETMIPQVRQDSIEIPGRHGEIVFDSYLESRRLFPTVLIPSQATLTDVQNILRKVSSLLLDKYGRPKDVKVVYDYEPEKYYTCRMNGYLSPDRIAKTGKFLIPLYANDPFAYAEMLAYEPEPKRYDVGNLYNQGDLYPNPVEVDWKYTTQYSSVYNHSLFATPLLINIKGSAEDIRIHNLTNDQAIMIDGLQVGEVDIGDLTVIKDGVNLMTKMRGDFVYLDPGENMIELHGMKPNAKVRYKWKHRFV